MRDCDQHPASAISGIRVGKYLLGRIICKNHDSTKVKARLRFLGCFDDTCAENLSFRVLLLYISSAESPIIA